MSDDNSGSIAKAAGVGLLGVLGMLGKFADDCGRAGARVASSADDIARVGARGADDVAGFADDVARFGDDLPLPPRRGALPHAPGRGVDVPLSQADEAYAEVVETVVEEGAYTVLETWLEEEDSDESASEVPTMPGRSGATVRVLWSFLPLSDASLEAYLGEVPSQGDIAGHERFRTTDKPVIKPIFSGLTVGRSMGLAEPLKVFVGYVAERQDHLLTWETGPAPIAALQATCLRQRQSCLMVACSEVDLDQPEPCAVAAVGLTKAIASAANVPRAIRSAVAWRNRYERDDMVFHVALVDGDEPRMLRSARHEATP
jgi:hypothetical protein